jgi:hypothetical protein
VRWAGSVGGVGGIDDIGRGGTAVAVGAGGWVPPRGGWLRISIGCPTTTGTSIGLAAGGAEGDGMDGVDGLGAAGEGSVPTAGAADVAGAVGVAGGVCAATASAGVASPVPPRSFW